MALDVRNSRESNVERVPSDDFLDRLGASLGRADAERRRHAWTRRARRALPLVLLVGPVVGWRLMLSTPDGVHISISAIAWLAFALDVGVHTDTTLLAGLHLQWLPSVVGLLIFALVVLTLLVRPTDP